MRLPRTLRLALGASLAACLVVPSTHAADKLIQSQPSQHAFALVEDGSATTLWLDASADPGVLRAARDFQADLERVTGVAPQLSTADAAPAAEVVLIGQIGQSPLLQRLADEGRLDLSPIEGKWEATLYQTLDQPLPGVDRALVIAGSDKRGTIYGLYELSEQSGVSPWYWWADAPVTRQEALYVRDGRTVEDGPVVRYRGIFLNDEAPALTGWAHEKFGGLNSEFYGHVFELILRLKGNYLWPAMWNNAFYLDDPRNPELAAEYGIVMGTSHHEPMTRAHQEWYREGEGAWNYQTNADNLREFWRKGIARSKDQENIITLAMRGDGDVAMSDETNTELLERIVGDQREIIAEEMDQPLEEIPQVWALYKEVQDYYEAGMRVPDDVTLLWADDNWGNVRRLPTADERERAGSAGVYYHFDYVGGPRSYKWLNTSPLPRVWEQMHLAWQYEANRIWIVNVGDLKPMELPIDFFLTYAWDPAAIAYEDLDAFHRDFAAQQFGPEHAGEIAELLAGYTKLNGRRNPELLSPDTFSLVHYGEAERVRREWLDLVERAEALEAELPDAYQSAYFQLVLYPILACATVNELYIDAGYNRLYGVQGRTSTNDLDERVRQLFDRDQALAERYHAINDGKWNHFMAQNNLGYTYWQQPPRDMMPAVTRLHIPEAAEMGVSVDGSPRAWPTHDVNKSGRVLPEFTVYGQETRHLEVFNRGREAFDFTIRASEPWLQVSPAQGRVELEQAVEVSVDWDAVPHGEHEASLTIEGTGQRVEIAVPVRNPASPRPADLTGFVETNGYVAIEAPHFQRAHAANDISWKTLPDFGRTLGAVTTFPVDVEPQDPIDGEAPYLEYDIHFFSTGEFDVILHLSPTLDFQPGPGLRYALAFDDAEPQVIKVDTLKDGGTWNQAVADRIRRSISQHRIEQPGAHTLKFWMVSPGVVLQRIVIDTGGLEDSYLGPPESPLFE